ncbi:MAG: HAD family hydrolase [Victivallaceae bacterium]|nr:HAD-IA family hydrolase [Victivallaceae bacterium]
MRDSGLFFDLDGTLIDSRADLACAVNLVLAEYKVSPLALSTVVSFVGDGLRNLARRSFSALPESEQDRALALLRRFYSEHEVDATTLYPGVRDGLAVLRRAGFVLAVVTNKPEPDSLHILKTLGIYDNFDEVIGADSGFAIKPSPDSILHLTAKYRLEPGRCWMLGDNHTDLGAARAAGISRAYAAWGFGSLKGETFDAEFAGFGEFAQAMLTDR